MANSFQQDFMSFLYIHKDTHDLVEVNDVIRKHHTIESKTIRDLINDYKNKGIINTDKENNFGLLGQSIKDKKYTVDNISIKAMLTPVDGVIFAKTHYIKSFTERNPLVINVIISFVSAILGALVSRLFEM